MTRKKKRLYIGLIIVGGMALMVDRLLLHGAAPESAVAGAPELPAAPRRSKPAPAATAGQVDAETAIPELVFPRNLPAYRDDAPLRDWFAPPSPPEKPTGFFANLMGSGSQIGSMLGNGPSPAPPEGGATVPHPVRLLGESVVLEGVMVMGPSRIAVISGRWLRVGDSFPETDCRVESIEDRAVEFDCRGEKKTLVVFDNVLNPHN